MLDLKDVDDIEVIVDIELDASLEPLVTQAHEARQRLGATRTGHSPVASLGSVQAFTVTKGGGHPPPVNLTMRPATVAGERVTLGVSCPTRTSCIAALFGLDRLVSGQLVQWSAVASGPSAARVRALVTSLTPVSGTLLPPPHRLSAGQ